MLLEHLELSGVVGDNTQTVFTNTKGIWQIKTTTGQVVEAMQHVSETLAKHQDDFPKVKKTSILLFHTLIP
eukprot:7257130-Ditylum_brightwellii.AAC.1